MLFFTGKWDDKMQSSQSCGEIRQDLFKGKCLCLLDCDYLIIEM